MNSMWETRLSVPMKKFHNSVLHRRCYAVSGAAPNELTFRGAYYLDLITLIKPSLATCTKYAVNEVSIIAISTHVINERRSVTLRGFLFISDGPAGFEVQGI